VLSVALGFPGKHPVCLADEWFSVSLGIEPFAVRLQEGAGHNEAHSSAPRQNCLRPRQTHPEILSKGEFPSALAILVLQQNKSRLQGIRVTRPI